MRILITGGLGQLGRALHTVLKEEHIAAPGRSELDATDRQQVREAMERWRPDAVIHAAAWTNTAGCEDDPARAARGNGEAPGLVPKACRERGGVRVYRSSNGGFDGDR